MRPARRHATLRLYLPAVLLLCALDAPGFGLGFSTHGQQEAEKREIVRLEHEWRTAQLSNNVAELDRLLADDYVGINVTGQVHTKAQLLTRMRNGDLTLSRIDLRDIRVKVLGDVAVVRVYATVQGTSRGAPLSGNFRYQRIYHRLPSGAWKITNFEATRVASHRAKLETVPSHRPYAS